MRQGNNLNEATAVSLATFLGEAIRASIQIVALQREAARGDRAIGTAETEFPLVHVGMGYDLTVDTSFSSADEAVKIILDWLRTDAGVQIGSRH